MSKLGCNIAMYRPDPDMLAAHYHPRHVEQLLREAGSLIDRCLVDFKEYCALDYAWNQFVAEMVEQQEEADVESKPEPEEEAAASTEESEAEAPVAAASEEAETSERGVDVRAELWRRKKELAAPGQPFALNEQRDMVLKRVCRDYEEALNRACVAEQGLKSIYHYADVPSPMPSEAETLSASITDLALWIRDHTEWLVRYHRREEPFTRVVSLRSLMSRSAWAHMKHSRDSFPTKLDFPADLFRSHDNCRLRGIGAYLLGDVGAVPWTLVVRLPDEAVYETSGQRVEVDQSGLPSCMIGSVQTRRNGSHPERYGATTLVNASPIGRASSEGMWTVNIYKPVGAASESFSHLEDVLIEIDVVGTPKAKM